MNILEQEDQLKGMPDSMLLVEMEQPSGMYPPFLVASEQQRRNTMRENYAATEQQPQTTVVEREYQKGLASSAMPPSSPAPVAPNSLPSSFPVDGYSQGSMGAGDLMMANTGGQFPDLSGDGKVTRKDILMGRGVMPMQEGRQAPSSLKDLRNGEAVVIARGENPANFSVAQLEAIGRTSPNQMGFMSTFLGDNHPAFGSVSYKRPEEEVDKISLEGLRENQIPASEMIDRYNLTAEYGKPFGGVGAEKPLTTLESMERNIKDDVQNLPTQQMSEYEKSLLNPSALAALEARDAIGAVPEIVGEIADPLVGGVLDFGTVLLSGDPTNPAEQRAVAAEEIGDTTGSLLSEYLPDFSFDDAISVTDQVGEYISNPETVERFGAGYQNLLDTYGDTVLQGISDFTGFTDYENNLNTREESNVSENPAVKTDAARSDFPTSSQETIMLGSQGILAGGPQQPGFVGGNMITDSLVRNAMREGIDEGLGIGEKSMINMEDAYGQFDTAQAEQTANLRDLIGRTRQEAKDRAFYMGIAALGAGIAKGDMAGGMDKAVEIASNITARGEASIAPLEAAAATQPAQAAKDRIDALAAIARADATFQNVRAQLVREGGLDRRSYNTLRGYALRAAQQAIGDMDYMEGLDTPEAIGKVLVQIADQMMGEYAPLMQQTSNELFTPNADGSYSFIGQLPE